MHTAARSTYTLVDSACRNSSVQGGAMAMFLDTLNNISQLFSCILVCVRCGSFNTPMPLSRGGLENVR